VGYYLSSVSVKMLLDLLARDTQCQKNPKVMTERGGSFEDEVFG
jgi:hypothetical protein